MTKDSDINDTPNEISHWAGQLAEFEYNLHKSINRLLSTLYGSMHDNTFGKFGKNPEASLDSQPSPAGRDRLSVAADALASIASALGGCPSQLIETVAAALLQASRECARADKLQGDLHESKLVEKRLRERADDEKRKTTAALLQANREFERANKLQDDLNAIYAAKNRLLSMFYGDMHGNTFGKNPVLDSLASKFGKNPETALDSQPSPAGRDRLSVAPDALASIANILGVSDCPTPWIEKIVAEIRRRTAESLAGIEPCNAPAPAPDAVLEGIHARATAWYRRTAESLASIEPCGAPDAVVKKTPA